MKLSITSAAVSLNRQFSRMRFKSNEWNRKGFAARCSNGSHMLHRSHVARILPIITGCCVFWKSFITRCELCLLQQCQYITVRHGKTAADALNVQALCSSCVALKITLQSWTHWEVQWVQSVEKYAPHKFHIQQRCFIFSSADHRTFFLLPSSHVWL